MSEQEEKAAKWEMVEQLTAAKSHLSVLQQRAVGLGRGLANFGKLLPDQNWTFWVEEGHIQGSSMGGRPMALISLDSLDKEKIVSLLKDLSETREQIRTLKDALKEAGV